MTPRARRTRKGRRAARGQEPELRERLTHGLTEEEIRQVAASALLALDQRGRDRLAGRLGQETGKTLRGLLVSRRGRREKAPPPPGAAKIREAWEKAWDKWDECVAESQDEDGRYVVRDNHWEAPYLDGASLAQDLEPIAAGMRAILERVMDDKLEPNFSFLAAVQELDAEIGAGLPDWMDPSSGDGCPLGPEVTGRLLEWEWRAGRQNGRSAFQLAESIRKLEASARIVSLDDDTITRFIGGLDDADQKAVLAGIVAHRNQSHWAPVLGAAHSGWFKIRQQLARRWDPALFEETGRKNIAQDWELALPLVAALLRRKAFGKAQALIDEAVRALLRLRRGETWDPREALLIAHPAFPHWSDQPAAVFRLLEGWRKVATGLDQEELACALDLQVAVGRRWADGDTVLDTFRQVPRRFADLGDRLFSAWRSLTVEATFADEADGRELPGAVWVRGLVDAARAGVTGAPAFRRAVREWLEGRGPAPGTLWSSIRALGTLTLDLDVGSTLRKTLPALHRQLSAHRHVEPAVTASRRRWVERLGVADLLPEVVEFWRRHAARLPPDPAAATGSNYDACVDWLAVVFELDSGAYHQVVRRWAGPHARRKNLWRAVTRRNLPL